MNLGDLPTWVAAIGTVGALVAALIQINTERKRRHAYEAREHDERRHAQARLVAAFLGKEEIRGRPPAKDEDRSRSDSGRTPIYIVNGSDEPAYEPIVAVVAIQGAAPHTIEQMLEYGKSRYKYGQRPPAPVMTVSIIPPGKSVVWVEGTGWSQHLSGRSGAEIAFTDRAGVHWIRRATGELTELPKSPYEYFTDHGLFTPYELQTPEPLS